MIGLFIHMCLDVYQTSQFNSKCTFSIKYLKCYIFNVEKSATNDILIVYLIVLFKDTINMYLNISYII